jgi:hypothetical protein
MKPKRNPPKPPKKAARGYSKHNLTPTIRKIQAKGLKALDQRSALALAMKKLRGELTTDLGGEESLSAQQKKLIDESIKKVVLLDSIDTWLFQQPAILNKRTKSLFPIVTQRMVIADSLMRVLKELGLTKVAKQISLQDYLNNKGSQQP